MSATLILRGASAIRMKWLPGLVSLPNSLAIGTVTTGAAGTAASATVTGAAPTQTLNLTVPKGDQGVQGIQGIQGAMAALAAGTVTTGAAGSAAAASITGAPGSQVLNLTIPRGADGTGAVNSVAGRSGNVVLTSSDVGLGNVTNTSDANKPVSTAQAAAISPSVSVVTGNWTVGTTDLGRQFVVGSAASAGVTGTLPASAGIGSGFSFRLRNSSSFTVTLVPNGSDTIDTPKILAKQDCRVIWDGTAWEVIGLQGRTLLVPTATATVITSAVLPPDYAAFDLEIQDFVPSGNASAFLQTSPDGSTFSSGATDYGFSSIYSTSGGASGSVLQSGTFFSLEAYTQQASQTVGLTADCRINPGTATTTPTFQSRALVIDASVGTTTSVIAGFRGAVGRVAAIRFGAIGGGSQSFRYRLWGIR